MAGMIVTSGRRALKIKFRKQIIENTQVYLGPEHDGDLAIDVSQIAEFDALDVGLDVEVDPEAAPKYDTKICKH